MKILVFAHRLEVGGTQVNAIELSAALRDLCGHDVVLFATPGPMSALAEEKGLRVLAAPDANSHPSAARMLALRDVVRHERPDVLHVWDWPQCLDAFYGTHMLQRVPMVVTDMSMVLSTFMPKTVPMTFGTPELVQQARLLGRRPVELLLPPVDTSFNAPGVVNGARFRRQYGVGESEILIVTVSRLTEWMKAESLRRTAEVVGELGRQLPLRFIVVGDGSARERFDELGKQVNAGLGRQAVVSIGAMLDPRPAYAAADLVVGMGGSALRGMAFAKPVLVVGELGFCAAFDRDTADDFYFRGIYGVGSGDPGNTALRGSLAAMVARREEFEELGRFSRQFVVCHFGLETLAPHLSGLLETAAREGASLGHATQDAVRTASLLVGRRLVPRHIRNRLLKRWSPTAT